MEEIKNYLTEDQIKELIVKRQETIIQCVDNILYTATADAVCMYDGDEESLKQIEKNKSALEKNSIVIEGAKKDIDFYNSLLGSANQKK